MKKRIQSMIAILLAMTLIMTAGAAAFADGEPVPDSGTIIINNAVNGQTYTVYRIFDLHSHNADYTAFNYKVNPAWAGFFAAGAEGLNYVDVDSMGYVTWRENASAAEFAAKAIAFAEANAVAADGQAVADGQVRITGLPLGYYLVKSGLGALCSLNTTKPEAVIQEKNANSTVDKLVQEDSTGIYGKTNDADIGQTVAFETTVTVVDGNPKNYILHDTMSAGLTFDPASVAIAVGETVLAAGVDYTLVTDDLTDGCTFEIRFTDGKLKTNDVVKVTYQAVVNADAVIAGTGNPNETKLSYGDQTTVTSETRTYVWQMDALKFAKADGEEKPLADAEFILYKKEAAAGGEKTYYAQLTDGKLTGWTETEAEATVIKTPAAGTFTIAGLDADVYYLEEVKSPAGYNMLKEPVRFEISAAVDAHTQEGTATVTYGEGAVGTVKIENKTGTLLPTTGGMGTTLFYLLGGVLAAGAGILLVTKKRVRKSSRND